MRITVPQIIARKNTAKIVVIAAYDFLSAKAIDGVADIILIGDSLGMVIYGFDSTLPVTTEMMANHTAAVVRGSAKSLIVTDLPFASYQGSPGQAFHNAAKLIQAGAQAVKLEGGAEMAETVKFLTTRGIPVMGHVGLQPQSFNAYGGFKVQGKSEEESGRILNAAMELEAAGCFSMVIEGVKKELADKITSQLDIPTIGIGASDECDGQVLVLHDLLGITPSPAKFVKDYGKLSSKITDAVKQYAEEVKSGKFPKKDNLY